nr:3,4-dihydroxy-2-butanone-4-phosphate synthase [Neobacillus sp. Marseille-Q6967]
MNTSSSVKHPLDQLKAGGLIIIYDDLRTHMGILAGLGEYVKPEKVNFMTKVGKGLIYVCITEEKAKQLQIPKMTNQNEQEEIKPFGVSVDYKDTTTGISSFERSDTIKALTDHDVIAEDFKRPGHIFPLISKKIGLHERIDLTEAVVDLTKIVSNTHVGYMCEILNSNGNIANKDEMKEISEIYNIPIIAISDILEMKKDEEICSFSGTVIHGRRIGRSIGFPTANIDIRAQDSDLPSGVYGVKVFLDKQEFTGIMNVGNRPTFHGDENSIHHEIHIFNFDQDIYGQNLHVKVCFFIREEISFPSIKELVSQIYQDSNMAKSRFSLLLAAT